MFPPGIQCHHIDCLGMFMTGSSEFAHLRWAPGRFPAGYIVPRLLVVGVRRDRVAEIRFGACRRLENRSLAG